MNITASQLRRAADIRDKIDSLQSELSKILAGGTEVGNGEVTAKRLGRPPGKSKRKRTMSAAGRAKIAAAARLRWKKAKAAGKNTL